MLQKVGSGAPVTLLNLHQFSSFILLSPMLEMTQRRRNITNEGTSADC